MHPNSAIPHAHEARVWGCAFSSDGSLLASASGDGTLKIWDADTGEETSRLDNPAGPVYACAFTPDASQLVGALDRNLKLWDVASGEEVMTLRGHTSSVMDCEVSQDGSFIVSAGWESEPQVGTLKLWDRDSGNERAMLVTEQRAVACAVSSDGAVVAAAGDLGDLQLWDVASGRMLRTVTHGYDPLNTCAFSPDGALVASACNDGTTKLWESATGDSRGVTMGGLWCEFTPDGRFVATADSKGVLRLWEVQSGKEYVSLPLPGPARVALHPRVPKAAAFVGEKQVDLYLVEFEGIRY
jgi:WD40 repeat protein